MSVSGNELEREYNGRSNEKYVSSHLNSFLSVMRPAFFLARILGITPIWISRAEDGSFEVKFSSWTVVHAYLGVSIHFGAGVIGIIFLWGRNILDLSECVFVFCRLSLTATILVISLIKCRRIVDLMRRIQEHGVTIWFMYRYLLSFVFAAFFFNCVMTEYLMMNLFFWEIMAHFTLNALSPFVVLFLYFLYMYQVKIVHTASCTLKSDLSKCQQTISKSNTLHLRPIMNGHMFLRRICTTINDHYGLLILLTNASMCIEVTYAIFHTIVSHWNMAYLMCGFWIFINVAPMLCLTSTCQNIENVFQELLTISLKLRHITAGSSEYIKEQVRELEIQLRHLPMKFTAMGLHDVNNAFTKAIISTVVTYAVILLQNAERPSMKFFKQGN